MLSIKQKQRKKISNTITKNTINLIYFWLVASVCEREKIKLTAQNTCSTFKYDEKAALCKWKIATQGL
jgi:hypothetical protein